MEAIHKLSDIVYNEYLSAEDLDYLLYSLCMKFRSAEFYEAETFNNELAILTFKYAIRYNLSQKQFRQNVDDFVLNNKFGINHWQPFDILKAKPVSDYQYYLNSSSWQEKRTSILNQRNNKCEKCGSQDDLHVHHLTYKNIGNEPDEDLMVLCKTCHEKIHNKQR